MSDMDSFQSNSLIDYNVCMIGQREGNGIPRLANIIVFIISVVLVIIFSILNKREAHDRNDDDDRSGILFLF
jgi:hypothetical protein